MKEDFGDIYFGTILANDVDWREQSIEENDQDPDDEELEETSLDVIEILGFDPKEFSEE